MPPSCLLLLATIELAVVCGVVGETECAEVINANAWQDDLSKPARWTYTIKPKTWKVFGRVHLEIYGKGLELENIVSADLLEGDDEADAGDEESRMMTRAGLLSVVLELSNPKGTTFTIDGV